MSNEVMNAAPAEEQKKYSPVRYAFGAVLAFFGISSATHRASKKRKKLVGDITVLLQPTHPGSSLPATLIGLHGRDLFQALVPL